MRNTPFFVLLGGLMAVGCGLGLSWELIFGVAGMLLGLFSLTKGEASERLLKSIACDMHGLADLREELRERLAPRGRVVDLLRRLFGRRKRRP